MALIPRLGVRRAASHARDARNLDMDVEPGKRGEERGN